MFLNHRSTDFTRRGHSYRRKALQAIMAVISRSDVIAHPELGVGTPQDTHGDRPRGSRDACNHRGRRGPTTELSRGDSPCLFAEPPVLASLPQLPLGDT